MGKVVKLDAKSKERSQGQASSRSRSGRRARSKTALVLGGGGFTGGVQDGGDGFFNDGVLTVTRTR
jgi:hypothetical protein